MPYLHECLVVMYPDPRTVHVIAPYSARYYTVQCTFCTVQRTLLHRTAHVITLYSARFAPYSARYCTVQCTLLHCTAHVLHRIALWHTVTHINTSRHTKTSSAVLSPQILKQNYATPFFVRISNLLKKEWSSQEQFMQISIKKIIT